MVWPPAGRSVSQTSLPVSVSKARNFWSVVAAMKVRPPAVTSGPPLFGVPMVSGSIDGMPNGPFFSALPSGWSQRVLPVARSMPRMRP